MEPSAAFEPQLLEAGDLVMLPRGHAHALSDDPSTPATPLMELIDKHLAGADHCPMVCGGGGDPTTLVCGYFTFDASQVHPLLTVLPPLVVVPGEGGRARSWLESSLDLVAAESVTDRPGSEILVDRLTEALFILILRSFLEEREGCNPSWMRGLRDPQIARALGMIHRQPDKRWSVEELAAGAAMSRSAFSTRFRELVGEPPLAYLTRWRMHMAANHLRDDQLTMLEVAQRVGYQAEASFSKVFKRAWGVAPGAYRRQLGA